ncbi:MAG: peptidylprolyl isomerase [Candidatus Paceibacterota bacterium]
MENKTIIIITLSVFVIAGIGIFLLSPKEQNTPNNNIPTENPSVNSQTENTNAPSTSINTAQPNNTNDQLKTDNSIVKNMNHIVTIKTNMGDIKFVTYDTDAPNTVKNFITLANKGFYDGLIFHRVIPGFMIQGGDPLGTGRGGPGYSFNDELNPQTESYKAGYVKGVVAMANSGPNTNGSQFFIMVADYPLQNNYTIFGKVISGQDVADAISEVKTNSDDLPNSKVIMEKVTVSNN